MGASLSIAKSFDVKQIYELCFLYGCEFFQLKQVNIAELEYLHRRYEDVKDLKAPIPKVLSRVLIVLFQTDTIDDHSFDTILKVFHSWRISSHTEKLESNIYF